EALEQRAPLGGGGWLHARRPEPFAERHGEYRPLRLPALERPGPAGFFGLRRNGRYGRDVGLWTAGRLHGTDGRLDGGAGGLHGTAWDVGRTCRWMTGRRGPE